MCLKGLKDEGKKHLILIVYVFGELAPYLGALKQFAYQLNPVEIKDLWPTDTNKSLQPY